MNYCEDMLTRIYFTSFYNQLLRLLLYFLMLQRFQIMIMGKAVSRSPHAEGTHSFLGSNKSITELRWTDATLFPSLTFPKSNQANRALGIGERVSERKRVILNTQDKSFCPLCFPRDSLLTFFMAPRPPKEKRKRKKERRRERETEGL